MGLFGKPDPRPANDSAPAPRAAPAAPKAGGKGTVMGEKTGYVGKIETDEPLLILGTVEGEIKSSDEVDIGETGDVKASLSARSIVISGRVTGDCSATDRLEIRASGKLYGNIKAARVSIVDGAEFKGTTQMTGSAKA